MQPIKLYWSVRSKNAALGLRENSEAGKGYGTKASTKKN